jgi:hypothetical protein
MADINFCRLGSESSQKIMFWGDSHVGQLYPVIQTIYNEGDLRDEGVLFAIADGCLPAERLELPIDVGGAYCPSFSKFAMIRAEEEDIDAVFIGFNTEFWEKIGRLFLQELAEHIRTLRGLGKRVIICLPFPRYDKSIPELEIRNAVFGRFGLGGIAKDLTLPALRERIKSIATHEGAELFDPRASLCRGNDCITQVNGVSIYIDSKHIAATEISVLESNLAQVLHPTPHIGSSFGD